LNFFYDQMLVKEPGTREGTPWRQDQPYWAVSGFQVCSLWLPLDPVSEEVGVEYVCESHLWPEFSPYHFADGTLYEGTGLPLLPDIDAERDRHRISRFAMEPGDVLVFQAMIVHGSPGNTSANRRRALATRWTGATLATVVARERSRSRRRIRGSRMERASIASDFLLSGPLRSSSLDRLRRELERFREG
jgi:ectoine hydroxylase-related dioxygenase (phytanoyl-CoA dioxygenase family)